jgi:hypothetical protein
MYLVLCSRFVLCTGYGIVSWAITVLGHKFKSKEHFRAKGALLYTIYLL